MYDLTTTISVMEISAVVSSLLALTLFAIAGIAINVRQSRQILQLEAQERAYEELRSRLTSKYQLLCLAYEQARVNRNEEATASVASQLLTFLQIFDPKAGASALDEAYGYGQQIRYLVLPKLRAQT